jgi:hypothetical protein
MHGTQLIDVPLSTVVCDNLSLTKQTAAKPELRVNCALTNVRSLSRDWAQIQARKKLLRNNAEMLRSL